MKDKITLAEYFEAIYNSIEFIEAYFEEDSLPRMVKNYCNAIMSKLNKIKEIIVT